MSKIITTDNGQQYKTPGFWPTAGAIVVGTMTNNTIKQLSGQVSVPIVRNMQEISGKMDNQILRKGIQDAFESSGLRAKGVEILDVKPSDNFKIPGFLKPFSFRPVGEGPSQSGRSFSDTISNAAENLPEPNKKLSEAISKEMPGWFRNSFLGKTYRYIMQYTFENGDNAAFFPKTNRIGVNIDKLGASTFHEMGHAINKNMSTFWKGMQKLRAPAIISASLMTLTALFKRPKAEGEQPKNKFDKATTFIKNNVGKLVSLTFVPIVAEELMATHRGNKLAKQFLPTDMFKKIKKTNRLGAATYILTGLTTGLAAFTASKVRDLIAAPKKVRLHSRIANHTTKTAG